MSPSEVADFLRTSVVQPKTSADLFLVAQNRLDEIRDNIAHGDFSVRGVYNPSDAPVLEEHMQNYLAHELDNRHRDQFTVVREPEVTRKKKPDIRLVHPVCDGPVTLEVKIAERCTGTELEDALRSQLVGTYMRANNSRFGILVVCSSGPSRRWTVANRNVEFEGIIAHLRAQAKEIARADPHVHGLVIVALDFH
jgi:hypothetical protein